MPTQEGQLHLLGAPHWSCAARERRDVPDNLPGYLVAYLAYRGDWVSREALAGLFWPERAEDEAQHNLRANLHRLRSLLAGWGSGEALQADRRRVRIALPTDVAAYRAALGRADWPAAVALHGEPLLSAMSFRGFALLEEWARGERQALIDAWRDAMQKAALAHEKAGEAQPAAALLLRLLQADAGTEDAMQALLRVASAGGRRDEALAAFDRYRVRLRDELGLQPVSATLTLADALRTAAPGPPSARPRKASTAADTEGAPRLRLLGPPLLHGEPPLPFAPERPFQLLAMLAVASGEWVPRDRLAAVLWPVHALTDARRNLRHVVFKARTFPGARDIKATDHALRWDVPTDLLALRRAVQAGRPGELLVTMRGTPLEGLDDPDNPALAEWLATERARIEALWHQAALDQLQQLDEPAQRRDLAQQMLRVDPLDEKAIAAFLMAELALGQRARAEERYRSYTALLMEELGVEPAHALRDLLAPASRPRLPSDAPDGAADAPASAFVGRRTELAELGLLLARADCRLVTVLGPGGIGKSSLARRALAAGVAGFPGGTRWVELQDLAEMAGVTARLAQQLGVDLKEGKDPVEQLGARLSGERLLIVLDNAEHLPELPALIERLLATGSALTLLITSRVRMFVEGEWLLPLEGLAVPDAESRDLEVAQAFDGVRLFALRATAAQRSFVLARHLDAVIEIVEAVAGMPLAIELASAWVRLLPPAEIAAELRQSPELLERDPGSPLRPARPEHASMRGVLERSWQLLAPREREAMLALSVFRVGFTRTAARAVADVPLPVLSSLVDKSFLRVDEDGRFGMHPLVAAHACVEARAHAEQFARLQDRHAEHFADAVGELVARSPWDDRPVVNALNRDVANYRAAWRRAIQAGRADLLRKMLPGWRRHFVATACFEEGARCLEEGLVLGTNRDESARRATAEMRAALAWFWYCRKDLTRAAAMASQTLVDAEAMDDPKLVCDCTATIGACHLWEGHWQKARDCFQQCLAVATQHGMRRETASALNNLGILSMRLAEHESSVDYYSRAMKLQLEMGNCTAVARLLHNLGVLHMARGDWRQAGDANQQALRYAIEHGIDSLSIPVEVNLGATLIELDALDAAILHLDHAQQRARAARFFAYELQAEYHTARAIVRRGEVQAGLMALLRAARRARDHGWIDDILIVAIFASEAVAQEGHVREARRMLGAVLSAPTSDSLAQTLARAVLGRIGGDPSDRPPGDIAKLDVDAIVRILADVSTPSELVERLGGKAA